MSRTERESNKKNKATAVRLMLVQGFTILLSVTDFLTLSKAFDVSLTLSPKFAS